jgi:N-dimethylarginine dimethylaminohydrolase
VTAVLPAPRSASPLERTPSPRRYLMCRPEHFEVSYAINPWMDVTRDVDRELALRQWETLRQTYLDLGHEVELIDPEPGLPDMVFAANGGIVVDGRAVVARFRDAQRAAEAAAYRRWYADAGFAPTRPGATFEGEGDLLVAGDTILAGYGFRTDRAAHDVVARVTGREVVSLELIDPRYYHLDVALCPLDADTIAYLPEAFSPAARAELERRFPAALTVTTHDATCLALNAVSDGRHVVTPVQAEDFSAMLASTGSRPSRSTSPSS